MHASNRTSKFSSVACTNNINNVGVNYEINDKKQEINCAEARLTLFLKTIFALTPMH